MGIARRPASMLAASALAICCVFCSPRRADAAEFKILATQALKEAFPELQALVESRTGNHLTVSFGTTGALATLVERGEPADAVILAHAAVGKLVLEGKLASRCAAVRIEADPCEIDVARVRVSMAARTGAPKPDINSPAALRTVLMSGQSVAYPDPADGGASGIALVRAAERIGALEQLQAHSVLARGGASAGAMVASGQAELAVQMHSELVLVPGIQIVGSLPSSLAPPIVFTLGVPSGSGDAAAARALVEVLRSPEGVAILTNYGMEPM